MSTDQELEAPGRLNGGDSDAPTATTEALVAPCWQDVTDVLGKHYTNPDIEAARILCAVLASHALKDYLPAWCLAIAPPGMDSEFLWILGEQWLLDSSSRACMSSKPDAPDTTEYKNGSDDEKSCTSELLIRKWLGIISPPRNGCTSNRYEYDPDAHAYLK